MRMTLRQAMKVGAIFHGATKPKPHNGLPLLGQLILLGVVIYLLTGCATMHKPGETPEGKAQDRYTCEQQTYVAAGGNTMLLSNGLYRDCMRAKGYK